MLHNNKKQKQYRIGRSEEGFSVAQLVIVVLVITGISAAVFNQISKKNREDAYDTRASNVKKLFEAGIDALDNYTLIYSENIHKRTPITVNGYTIPAASVRNPTIEQLAGIGLISDKYQVGVKYPGIDVRIKNELTVPGCTDTAIANGVRCNIKYSIKTDNFIPSPESVRRGTPSPDIDRANRIANSINSMTAGVSLPDSYGGDNSAYFSANGHLLDVNPNPNQLGYILVSQYRTTSVMDQFLPRDGSRPMEGDLQMQGTSGEKNSIKNAKDVQTETITFDLKPDATYRNVFCNSRDKGKSMLTDKNQLLVCNGSKYVSITAQPIRYTRYAFDSNSTFVVPDHADHILVSMIGSGGNALSYTNLDTLYGGHSGGYVIQQPIKTDQNKTYKIYINDGIEPHESPNLILVGEENGKRIVQLPNWAANATYMGDPGRSTKMNVVVGGIEYSTLRCFGAAGVVTQRPIRRITDNSTNKILNFRWRELGPLEVFNPDTDFVNTYRNPSLGNQENQDRPGRCFSYNNIPIGEGEFGQVVHVTDQPRGYARGGRVDYFGDYGAGGDSYKDTVCVTYAFRLLSPQPCVFTEPGRKGVVFIEVPENVR